MRYNFFIPLLFLSICDESVLVVARVDVQKLKDEREWAEQERIRGASALQVVGKAKLGSAVDPTKGAMITAIIWKMITVKAAMIAAVILAIVLIILIFTGKAAVDKAQNKAIQKVDRKITDVLSYNSLVSTKVGVITANMNGYIDRITDMGEQQEKAAGNNRDEFRTRQVDYRDWFNDQTAVHKYEMKAMDSRFGNTESHLAYFYRKIKKRLDIAQEANKLDQLKHFEWAENACVSLEQKINRIKKSVKAEGDMAAQTFKSFDKQYQTMIKAQNMVDMNKANIGWTTFSEAMRQSWELAWTARKRYKKLKATMTKDYAKMMKLIANSKVYTAKFEERLKAPGPYAGLFAKAKTISVNREKFFKDRGIKVDKTKDGLDRMGKFVEIYMKEMFQSLGDSKKEQFKDANDEFKAMYEEIDPELEGARTQMDKTGQAVAAYGDSAKRKLEMFPDVTSTFSADMNKKTPVIIGRWGKEYDSLSNNARAAHAGSEALTDQRVKGATILVNKGKDAIQSTVDIYTDEQNSTTEDARQQLTNLAEDQAQQQEILGQFIPKEEKLFDRQMQAFDKKGDRANVGLERLRKKVADTQVEARQLSSASAAGVFGELVQHGIEQNSHQWNSEELTAERTAKDFDKELDETRKSEKEEARGVESDVQNMTRQISKSRTVVKSTNLHMNDEIRAIDAMSPQMRSKSDEISGQILTDQESFSANVIGLDGALQRVQRQGVQAGLEAAGKNLVTGGKKLESILFRMVDHVTGALKDSEPELKRLAKIQATTVGEATTMVADLSKHAGELKTKMFGGLKEVTGDSEEVEKVAKKVKKELRTDGEAVTDTVGEEFKDAEGNFKKAVDGYEFPQLASVGSTRALAALHTALTDVLRSNPADKEYTENLQELMGKASEVATKLSGSGELFAGNTNNVAMRVESVLEGMDDAARKEKEAMQERVDKEGQAALYDPSTLNTITNEINHLKAESASEKERLATQLRLQDNGEETDFATTTNSLSAEEQRLASATNNELLAQLNAEAAAETRNKNLHGTINQLGKILAADHLELMRHPAREQDRLLEGYKAIGTDIDELFGQISMMKDTLDKAGLDTSRYDEAVAKGGLNSAVQKLTEVERDAAAVGNVISGAARMQKQADGQLDGDVDQAKHLASQHEKEIQAALSKGMGGAGNLIHLLDKESQTMIKDATQQIAGLSSALTDSVNSLPHLQKIFIDQANAKKEIIAYKEQMRAQTTAEADRVNAALSQVEASERNEKDMSKQIEDQQEAAMYGAGHVQLPSMTASTGDIGDTVLESLGGINQEKNTQDTIMANKVKKNDENLEESIGYYGEYRDELAKDFENESKLAQSVVEDERNAATKAISEAGGERATTGEELTSLESRANELKTNVKKLYTTAEHFNSQESIGDTVKFQQQKTEIKDLAKSLKYYGISYQGSLEQTGESDSILDEADLDSIEATLRNEDQATQTRVAAAESSKKSLWDMMR